MLMLRTLAVLAVMMALVAPTSAQSPRTGAITGTVTEHGDVVAGATIQAQEQSTGKIFTSAADKTGRFRLADLPAGTYEISVPQLGLRTSRYVQPNVVVEGAKTLTLNIALMPNNFGIVGDDQAFVQMLNKYANIKGPAPRMPDGKPDFSGIWLANVDP